MTPASLRQLSLGELADLLLYQEPACTLREVGSRLQELATAHDATAATADCERRALDELREAVAVALHAPTRQKLFAALVALAAHTFVDPQALRRLRDWSADL